jgi:hypothetical protein
MSQRDHGKHVIGHNEDGSEIRSKKRLDQTPPTPALLARQTAFKNNLNSVDSKLRGGFNEPGSMQRRSK